MANINIKFPIEDDIEKGRYLKLNSTTKDALTSDLMLLLLTEKGQRYYQPDYGTFLKKFIFEPNDSLTQVDVEKDIKTTVKNFIPTLTVKSVKFYRYEDQQGNTLNDNQLNVSISFTYEEGTFSETGELELSF